MSRAKLEAGTTRLTQEQLRSARLEAQLDRRTAQLFAYQDAAAVAKAANVSLGQWRVVVAPRGDVVALTTSYDEYQDGRTLMGMNSHGYLDAGRGDRVTVNGAHVTMAWRVRS